MTTKHHNKEAIEQLYYKRGNDKYNLDFHSWYIQHYYPNAFTSTNKQRKNQRNNEVNFDVENVEKKRYILPLNLYNDNITSIERVENVVIFNHLTDGNYRIDNLIDMYLDLNTGDLILSKADMYKEIVKARINDNGELIITIDDLYNLNENL